MEFFSAAASLRGGWGARGCKGTCCRALGALEPVDVFECVYEAYITASSIKRGQGIVHDLRPALTRVDMLQGGGYYKGEWQGNQRYGDGVLVSEKGDRYAGYFVSGLRDGFGRQIYGNMDSYEGRWKQDTYEGEGRYTSPQRFELYEGDFSAGNRHGEGQLHVRGKLQYKGTWEHGAMHGTGEFHAEDGSVYTGQFENNQMHGKGKLTANRALHVWNFEGEFKGNKRSVTATRGDRGALVVLGDQFFVSRVQCPSGYRRNTEVLCHPGDRMDTELAS